MRNRFRSNRAAMSAASSSTWLTSLTFVTPEQEEQLLILVPGRILGVPWLSRHRAGAGCVGKLTRMCCSSVV